MQKHSLKLKESNEEYKVKCFYKNFKIDVYIHIEHIQKA